MEKNNEFLSRFTDPITKFGFNDAAVKNDLVERELKFREENAGIPFEEFMAKAEKEFGTEVKYYERYYRFKQLSGIHAMMKFFVIITVVSIAATCLLFLFPLL